MQMNAGTKHKTVMWQEIRTQFYLVCIVTRLLIFPTYLQCCTYHLNTEASRERTVQVSNGTEQVLKHHFHLSFKFNKDVISCKAFTPYYQPFLFWESTLLLYSAHDVH